MRQIIINLDSRDRYLLYQEAIRQGENLGAEIVVNLNAEFTGYRYLMRFKLNNSDTAATTELPVINNQVRYPVPAIFTAQAGELKIVFEAFEQISGGNNRVIKSATTTLKVIESLDGGTEIMPEEYVPWYLEAVEKASEAAQSATTAGQQATIATQQAGIATTKAQEAAQSVIDAGIAGEAAAREVVNNTMLKVATLDKEVSEFQHTLASMNVNQEAKPTVTGYDILSLPKDAANEQAGVGLKGMSLYNELNYNKNTWAEWTKSAGVIGDNTGLEFTFSTTNYCNAYCPTNLKPNTKYLILVNAILNTTTKPLQLNNHLTGSYVNTVPGGFVGNCKVIITTQNVITNNRISFVQAANEIVEGLKLKLAPTIRCYELPSGSQIESDANTMTVDQLAIKYPYVKGDGIKSVPAAGRVRGNGINLFNKDNPAKHKWSNAGDFNVIPLETGFKLKTISTGTYQYYYFPIKLKPNTAYYFNWDMAKIAGGSGVGGARIRSLTTMTYLTSDTKSFTTDNVGNYEFAFICAWATSESAEVDFTNIRLVEGTTSKLYESYKESRQYYTVTENGQIAELRSLPNGTKDEIRDGQKIKKVSDKMIIDGNKVILRHNIPVRHTNSTAIHIRLDINSTVPSNTATSDNNAIVFIKGIQFNPQSNWGIDNAAYWDTPNNYCIQSTPSEGKMTIKLSIAHSDSGWTDIPTIQQIKDYFTANPMTLIYQLTTSVITPVQVSGTLLSYPSGTVYYEKAVADAGIYSAGITILHQDLPIQSIEKISKVDFTTGIETELDVSAAVIATDKKSFTHSGLANNDIVFFTYFYDLDVPIPELSVEFYDSRYVLKDSVTGKYYKVVQTVANGVLTQTLVEVV